MYYRKWILKNALAEQIAKRTSSGSNGSSKCGSSTLTNGTNGSSSGSINLKD